jgi:hypothetical protein
VLELARFQLIRMQGVKDEQCRRPAVDEPAEFGVVGDDLRQETRVRDASEPADRPNQGLVAEGLRQVVQRLARQRLGLREPGGLLERPARGPELMRLTWALQVLEGIGTPEARRVLESLTTGSPQAKASLDRLLKRRKGDIVDHRLAK